MLDATGVVSETDLGQPANGAANDRWADVLADVGEAAEPVQPDVKTEQPGAERSAEPQVAAPVSAQVPEPPEVNGPPMATMEIETPPENIEILATETRTMLGERMQAIEDAQRRVKLAKQHLQQALRELAQVLDMEAAETRPVAEAATDEPAAVAPVIEGDWREVKLSAIGVPKGTCEVLAATPSGEIITLGDLAGLFATKPGPDPLLTIPKIGQAKRDRIIDCCLAVPQFREAIQG